MFIWDFVASSVMEELMDWFYGQTVGLLGVFFSEMNSMGVELFQLDWAPYGSRHADPRRL